MTPSNAQLRQFIMQAFSDEELETLCFDYFPEVQQNFTGGMTKNRMALALISYCDSRGRRGDLLATLRREREGMWDAAFGASATSDAPRPAPASTAPVTRNPRQIFLSHATADAEFAHQLAADLRQEGWAVWIAPDSIQPGEKWVEAINRGLEESGVFVVVLTPDAVASRWVQTETNEAIAMEHEDLIQFIPLEHISSRLPRLWRGYQYVSFRTSYKVGLIALLDRLDGKRTASTSSQLRPRKKVDRYMHFQSGIELIRIPAGPFLVGLTDEHKDNSYDKKSLLKTELPEYWIGLTPVTNDQFSRFVSATGYKTIAELQGRGKVWMGGKWEWIDGSDWRHPSGPDFSIASKGDHPVVQISWFDAVAFCEWGGLQLPTEEEWEKAARGDRDDRTWPWGNELPTPKHCNFNNHVGDTTAVGRYSPRGDSPYGCQDMVGNVWEWTNSWYDRDQDTRVLRGGSWNNDQGFARMATRYDCTPDDFDFFSGFRVAAHILSSS